MELLHIPTHCGMAGIAQDVCQKGRSKDLLLSEPSLTVLAYCSKRTAAKEGHSKAGGIQLVVTLGKVAPRTGTCCVAAPGTEKITQVLKSGLKISDLSEGQRALAPSPVGRCRCRPLRRKFRLDRGAAGCPH